MISTIAGKRFTAVRSKQSISTGTAHKENYPRIDSMLAEDLQIQCKALCSVGVKETFDLLLPSQRGRIYEMNE